MTMGGRWLRSFGLGRALGLLVLVGMIALRIWDPPPIEAVRLKTFDFYQLLKPREITSRPVVIVDIDDESLKSLGQWPWPRTLLAELVTRLTSMGAAAIGFDTVFAEPDRLSPQVVVQSFRDLDEATREKLASMPNNDEAFAEAMRKSRVILGESGYNLVADPSAIKPEQTNFGVKVLPNAPQDPSPYMINFPALIGNIPVLQNAAAGRGLFSIDPERDGIVRRVPLVMKANGVVTPSLSLEMWRAVSGGNALVVTMDRPGIASVRVGGIEIPTDNQGRLWVHFSRHDRAKYVPARDVLSGNVPADRFAQRFVLVGTSAIGLFDNKTTPVDPTMPGVEIHAQVLETVFGHSSLTAPANIIGWELLGTLVVGLLIIGVGPMLGAATLFLAGAVVGAATAGLSWYSFAYERLLVDATFPMGASFSVYAVLVFTNYVREEADRRQIRSAFGQYLSPALVEQLARSPDKLVLGGEQRNMTVLFSDVRGFTAISERYKNDPQGLTSLMNNLLTPLTNAIIAHQGTIDKYMGDAIMAFWNAPVDVPNHELHACTAALDMLDRLKGLNEERKREAEATGQTHLPLRVGVGLNSGLCVVGNMGSDLRFDYSVFGDTVNLASRLEGQSATYGTPIVIGSQTAAAVNGKMTTLEIDYVAVKGKTQPEYVHTVLGASELAETEDFRALRDAHIEMLAHYRERRFNEAQELLDRRREIYERFGLTQLAGIYYGRIAAYLVKPPPENWDGSLKLETK